MISIVNDVSGTVMKYL